MDKQQFFKLLSDQAATPDPAFIAKLQKKIVKIAGGGGPFAGLNNPLFIGIGAIIGTGLIGGFLVFGSSNPSIENTQPVVKSAQTPNNENVLVKQSVKEDDEDQSKPDEPEDSNSVPPEEKPSQDDDPAPTAPIDDSSDTTEAPTSSDFTVSFWDYLVFKLPPEIPDTEPDLILENVETIDFDWGFDSPDESLDADYFVARAEATKYFDPGQYQINMTIDDGVRVYINGENIYERWNNSTGKGDKAIFTVQDGSEISIVIEYFEQTQSAIFKAVIEPYLDPAAPPSQFQLGI